MRTLFWLLFVIAIFFEGTLTTLPLTLIVLMCLMITKQKEMFFLIAFSAGILLDYVAFRPLGLSSIFFIGVLFVALLYERKYEINSFPFILFASFFSSLLYLVVFQASNIFSQAVVSMVFAAGLYWIYRIASKPHSKKTY